MLNHNIDSLVNYAKNLHTYCEAWQNAAMGAQYCKPIKTLNNYLPNQTSLSVLDWGCGDGHFSYLIGLKNYFIHSYSFSEMGPIESKLKEKFDKKFIFNKSSNSHPTHLPYINEKFDVVFSVGVLEHVQEFGGEEIASLKEIHRILKNDGYVFIFHFPNKYSWIEFCHRALKALKITNKHVHPIRYNKCTIQEMARMSNFSVREIYLYNLFPRNIFKFLPKSIGNNKLFVAFISFIENILSCFLKIFSQNYCVVLQKRK